MYVLLLLLCWECNASILISDAALLIQLLIHWFLFLFFTEILFFLICDFFFFLYVYSRCHYLLVCCHHLLVCCHLGLIWPLSVRHQACARAFHRGFLGVQICSFVMITDTWHTATEWDDGQILSQSLSTIIWTMKWKYWERIKWFLMNSCLFGCCQ